MGRARQFLYRLRGTLRRARTERELDEEISTHLSLLERRLVERGLPAEDARRRARREFGGATRLKESLRPDRMLTGIEQIVADLRYAMFSLFRNPGYALAAVISIALAIGANSAIFSYADGLLFRPLPVRNPSEVVSLRSLSPSASSAMLVGTDRMSWPEFVDFRSRMRSFEGLVAYNDIGVALSPASGGPSHFVGGYLVSGDFFQVMGVEPAFGRAFSVEEDSVPGRDPVLVLGHGFWTSVFGADSSVVGRKVDLNGLVFTVVGVAPESFTGAELFIRGDFYVPVTMGPAILGATGNAFADQFLANRSMRNFRVKGRLKQGVSIEEASEEAAVVAAALASAYPDTNTERGASVHTEVDMRLQSYPMLGLLITSLFFIVVVNLLVACANVANLFLTRGRTRSREIAVRLALGASRARLVKLLVSEGVLIAVAAAGLSMLVAYAAIGIFSTIEIDDAISLSFRMDTRVVAFTTLVSVASVLLFALPPALASTQPDLSRRTRTDEPSDSGGRIRGRVVLATAQIAGSMALLALSAGFQLVFTEALRADPGFGTAGRLTMRLDPSLAGYRPEEIQRFYDDLVDRVADVPRIRSAALASTIPLSWFNLGVTTVVPEGYDFAPPTDGVDVFIAIVDDHYFETMGIHIVDGRGISPTDQPDTPTVVVVNEAFARDYFPSGAVGKHLRLPHGGGTDAEVVGVVPTAKKLSIIEPPIPQIFVALAQTPQTHMTLVTEIEGDPSAVAPGIEEVIRARNPEVGIFQTRTMSDVFESGSVDMLRVVGATSTAASVIGLILALVGLYALVSFQVASRTREIGIRMALGAHRREILAMFLRQAGLIAVTGIAIGASLSILAGGFADATLRGLRFDVRLLLLVAAAMFSTTVAAALIPARRAASIDPQAALREE